MSRGRGATDAERLWRLERCWRWSLVWPKSSTWMSGLRKPFKVHLPLVTRTGMERPIFKRVESSVASALPPDRLADSWFFGPKV